MLAGGELLKEGGKGPRHDRSLMESLKCSLTLVGGGKPWKVIKQRGRGLDLEKPKAGTVRGPEPAYRDNLMGVWGRGGGKERRASLRGIPSRG